MIGRGAASVKNLNIAPSLPGRAHKHVKKSSRLTWPEQLQVIRIPPGSRTAKAKRFNQ